ncbi:uncharacterized protein BDZ99DRAFT_463383 [Mytilinidion resinicola]|uniref:Heterokaryon incompatibility domain-containing protein n=1 Tax=Mytilinidion resinicola TaxID=574789 RepID=A0A6A6YP03_9PEZI|nr:uncharacterized protein BDZ99DRAFT_463383 [Mytilinidion resinicola]KAF2809597.1 hypothetical protein BDZ99DRAFT_463383 [Mytilinidion resinicola]
MSRSILRRCVYWINASSEDVVCSLSCFPMDNPPEYYALSYVWGKEKPTDSII